MIFRLGYSQSNVCVLVLRLLLEKSLGRGLYQFRWRVKKNRHSCEYFFNFYHQASLLPKISPRHLWTYIKKNSFFYETPLPSKTVFTKFVLDSMLNPPPAPSRVASSEAKPDYRFGFYSIHVESCLRGFTVLEPALKLALPMAKFEVQP